MRCIAHGCDYSQTRVSTLFSKIWESLEKGCKRQWMQNIRFDGLFTVSNFLLCMDGNIWLWYQKTPHWEFISDMCCVEAWFLLKYHLWNALARALTSIFGFSFDPVEDGSVTVHLASGGTAKLWRVVTTQGWEWYTIARTCISLHNNISVHQHNKYKIRCKLMD